MAEIHDRILRELFKEKETTNWINLFEVISEVDKQSIRAKAKELASTELDFIEIKSHVTMPYTYKQGNLVEEAKLKKIREREKWEYDNQLFARIKYKGVSEWLRITGQETQKRKLTRAERIGIRLTIAGIVVAALVAIFIAIFD